MDLVALKEMFNTDHLTEEQMLECVDRFNNCKGVAERDSIIQEYHLTPKGDVEE